MKFNYSLGKLPIIGIKLKLAIIHQPITLILVGEVATMVVCLELIWAQILMFVNTPKVNWR